MPSQTMFEYYRESLNSAGLTTSRSDMLICPMCWHEVAVEKLTVEHVVPGSVVGTSTVLTCQNCNNTHGSKLDSHLVNHQLVTDAFQGHGSIPVEMSANGKKVRANIVWGQESKKITIVGKASNPQHCAAIESEMKAGQVESFDLTFFFKTPIAGFRRQCSARATWHCLKPAATSMPPAKKRKSFGEGSQMTPWTTHH